MILHIPHAATAIPPAVRRALLLDEAALARELLRMTDHFTDALFSPGAGAGDSVLRFPVSRLAVDPERFEDDAREPMARLGMGVIYTRTSSGTALRRPPTDAQRRALLAAWYHPHHRALLAAVQRELAAGGRCLVVDCHSFPARALPYEDAALARPDFCVGTDAYHTPAALRDALLRTFRRRGCTTAVDQPFSGALVPLPCYRRDRRVAAVMIEVKRSLYMDEATGERHGGFDRVSALLGEALAALRAQATGSAAARRADRPPV